VVLAYDIEIELVINTLPKDQHNNYIWFSEQSILMDNGVHKHTKWYIQKEFNTDPLKYMNVVNQ
jgi:colanic acid biosynthesis protein WcaH